MNEEQTTQIKTVTFKEVRGEVEVNTINGIPVSYNYETGEYCPRTRRTRVRTQARPSRVRAFMQAFQTAYHQTAV